MQGAYFISSFRANNKISQHYQYLISILLVCLVSAICFLFSVYRAQVVAFILLLTSPDRYVL